LKIRKKWWKTTIFLVFEKNQKFGGKPPVLMDFSKNRKSGGFPPVLMDFSKNWNKWWVSTTFHGFHKKPPIVVVFHHFICLYLFILFILYFTYFGGKPPVFMDFLKNRQNWLKTAHSLGFFRKPSKVVVFRPFVQISEKTMKSGGFPPLFRFF